MEGRCSCGATRYRLTDKPLFVHCCHCRWCQRETGTAFALNALIEAARVEILAGTPEWTDIPSESGRGQSVARCASCRVALWSVYGGSGPLLWYIRVGTLDDPASCPPDVHIYTESKRPWVIVPESVPSFARYYRRSEIWPPESLSRRAAALAGP